MTEPGNTEEAPDVTLSERPSPTPPSTDPEMNTTLDKSPTRAASSDGTGRPPSTSEADLAPRTSSSGDTGRSSRSRKKKGSAPPGSHRVTFTVTIAQAIPTVFQHSDAADIVDEPSPNNPGTVDDDEQADGRETGKKKKRVVEAPRAQNYFHTEYVLLPEDDDPVKTDVVTFGMAAKIYTERQEPKVLKTWQDGDLTWVAWTHCHTVAVTEELLLKLCNHTMELRVWDTKDKVSARARFDRPRAFRFPQPKPGEDADSVGGVKALVMKQSAGFEKMQPKRSYIGRPLPSSTPVERDTELDVPERPVKSSPEKPATRAGTDNNKDSRGRKSRKTEINKSSKSKKSKSKSPTRTGKSKSPSRMEVLPESAEAAGQKTGTPATDNILVHVATTDQSPQRSYSRLGKLAGVEPPVEPKEPKSRAPSRKKKSESKDDLATGGRQGQGRGSTAEDADGTGSGPRTPSRQDGSKSRRGKKMDAAAMAAAEQVKKFGVCCVPLRMAKILAGMQTVTERLNKTVPGIEDIFVTVSLSGPLMSEELERRLNPLVIKVHAASNMPNTPLSFQQLQQRCQPAYVKYNLYKQPTHCSVGREQDDSIYWDDINVILAGTIEPSELREYLNGPPLEIELHDRDRIMEKQKLKPTLFGDDLGDEKISNVGIVASKRTLHNPFTGRDQPWDPFGVARFDLSGLLLGQQTIHLTAPVHCCPLPDVLGLRDGKQDGKLIGVAGSVDGPEDAPLPAGHYLQCNAMMKVKVEVAHPIVTPAEVAANQQLGSTYECPFSRLVYRFAYKNVTFLHQLQSLITDINCEALEMSDMPPHVIQTALSTYKLSVEQQQSRRLDIVTGFQVLDGTMHLFVLEGLRDRAIARLWDTLPKPQESDVEILYNSDLTFKERLYGPLDVDVTRVKLHEPLYVIVQQPLLYVRDMVPKPCFEALVKLEELTQMSRLRDAVRNNLFPTAQMVISMSREFGVPMTAEDFEELQPEPPSQPQIQHHYELPHTSRLWTPIDNYNSRYEENLQQRAQTAGVKDFQRENIEVVAQRSAENRLQRSKTMPVTIKVEGPVTHNYSSQTLNSTEQAKEKLRNVLAEEPDRRFTYCPDYHHSMTVVPVNVEAQKNQADQASKDAWKTAKGWIYPGKKTMIESNKHERKPDVARAEDLQTPWTENSLHARYRPTLNRERYTWSRRQYDLDIWTSPNPVFGKNEPITIHLAGQKLRAEKQAAQRAEYEKWRSKIVTDDTRTRFHRCATETELKEEGFKSSNQLDRLHGLLKDSPHKYSLKRPGCALRDIPPLNVVLNPSVDTLSREAGLPVLAAVAHPGELEKSKGFLPGPYAELSWTLERNQIPVRDYEHEKFKNSRGQDFNVYHKERSGLFKRNIHPLTDDEYDTHLFRMPSDLIRSHTYTDLPTTSYVIPDIEAFKRRHLTEGTIDSGIASMSRGVTDMTEPGLAQAV